MKFEIDFNKVAWQTQENYKLLENIEGVYVKEEDAGKLGCLRYYLREVKDFKELEILENLLMNTFPEFTAMIVGFDHPTIYLEL